MPLYAPIYSGAWHSLLKCIRVTGALLDMFDIVTDCFGILRLPLQCSMTDGTKKEKRNRDERRQGARENKLACGNRQVWIKL